MITVYTTGPGCQQCVATKRHLDKLGVPYTEVDLRGEPEIAEALRAAGYTTAPIVDVPGQPRPITGYRPDELDKIAAALR
ncbi:NrdH [Mycobacterium phage DS6A]|uniref:NrdH n=1 Tax=Mycobacterium phage DS6A TaxID=45764 RepID=G8I4I4_9CAUD|nr:NrdH [Mycobacterium phage DS6A]AER47628.1 NrdH [Mycobacterium phage DS6A]